MVDLTFAKAFMHEHAPSRWETMKPGDVLDHPEHGRVTITSGQYWGTHGLSNFWYWEDEDGEEHHGYGW
jgi:hypothetical protein